ncbi:MAG: M56 family metallopeptidase [Hyphomonadaceae bacterium]
MTLLIWLAASSLAWGGVLWIVGRALQRSMHVSGAVRQWIWRGATVLLLAPWIAAPFVVMFGLGLAPAETIAAATVATVPKAETIAALQSLDDAYVQTQVVTNGGSAIVWLSARNLPEMLLIAMIAGWIVRFVLAQLALRSLLGIVNVSREAEPGVAQSFVQAWAARLKLRPAPRLRIVAEKHSPFSYGLLRPTICVPEGMEDRLSRGSLDLVVGHESLHIARGDGWLRPVERVTADILWFNPFAWLIRRELDVARELAVDEAVLAMSNARVAYARTLRDVAGFAAGLSSTAPAASMSLPGGRNLMMRVSRTLAHAGQKPARATLVAACLVGLAAAPIALAQVMMAVPAPPALPPVEAVEPVDVVEPVEGVAAVEAGAEVEPAPPLPAAAPLAPVPPVPPVTPPAGEFNSKSGKVSATFRSRVISTSGDATNGYRVELLETARNEQDEICLADLSGLGELNVKQGDIVGEGQVVGEARKGNRMRFSVVCSDDLDETGRPKASPPPVPPVAPAYTPQPMRAPVAPLPPMPPMRTPAPMAAPAPLLPSMIAPLAPPAPYTPTPMVAPTPPTPVTPVTPVTPPPALDGAASDSQ